MDRRHQRREGSFRDRSGANPAGYGPIEVRCRAGSATGPRYLHTVGRRPEIGDAGDAPSGYLRRDTGRRRLEVGNPRDAPPSHRLRSPNRGSAEG